MQLYSTRHISPNVGFEEAIFRGLPPDNGLYMPTEIPAFPAAFWEEIDTLSFPEIAYRTAQLLIGDDIPADALKKIVYEAVNFDAPLVSIAPHTHVLELWHGPSLAFKDFGARFMSRVMGYFLSKTQKHIHILVATSGDTGGAVAMGFLGTPGIRVTILYPSGKVSHLQEKQLTTLGQNISALEIDGTFDDCQALVKQAFLDEEVKQKHNLSSANSINISRLIPQSFYYLNSYAKLKKTGRPVVFSVPSGNFGNLGAGLLASRMGMPAQFVAATNANHIVPHYLETGNFEPKPSVRTISNAMDVGNPSNFPRLLALSGDQPETLKAKVTGYWANDEQTLEAIRKVHKDTGYMMCPHTAVAWLGLQQYMSKHPESEGVLLSTAHAAKFLDELPKDISSAIEIPEALSILEKKQKTAEKMGKDYESFKNWLLNH